MAQYCYKHLERDLRRNAGANQPADGTHRGASDHPGHSNLQHDLNDIAVEITNIARNIDKVGFVVPCLVDDEDRVLAGNARIEAAARLGMAMVPVVRLRHLSEPEKRAFIIADNKLPELTSWDQTSLRQEHAAGLAPDISESARAAA